MEKVDNDEFEKKIIKFIEEKEKEKSILEQDIKIIEDIDNEIKKLQEKKEEITFIFNKHKELFG